MSTSSKGGLAILLIGSGALILLAKFGIGGALAGFLFPLLLIGLGYYGIRRGSKFFGWVLFIIGLFSLLSKFSGLFIILFAAALIVFGVMMLREKRLR